MKMTQPMVRELFRYDKDKGELFWLTRLNNRCRLDKPAGYLSNGYRVIIAYRGRYLAHRLTWLYHYGYFPENFLDHIDRNPSNNHIENLREVSQSCNIKNTGNSTRNKSGVKGICWSKASKKWRVNISINQKQTHLGLFVNFIDAVKARYEKEGELNWENCDATSPAKLYLLHHAK